MKLSLIICTYKRAEPLLRLLDSVKVQSYLPDEILIIDGSPDDDTKHALNKINLKELNYYKVKPEQRGLTKQRNIGIELCDKKAQIIAFLDDDIILYPDYFKNLLATYSTQDDAIAVGGYIVNEVKWLKESLVQDSANYFCFDQYCRKESSRFRFRSKFRLAPNRPPAHLPKFSHGRSVGFLPPSGKIYAVEQFMGGVSSYKKEVFKKLQFSSYFEGYGLYEDADFCFRLRKLGQLYVNTAAQCEHHHHPSGRPNQFQYGQMVVKNGWYVWRLRWPNPGFKNVLKWHANVLLLAFLRFLNAFTTANKKQAFTESCGRFWAWLKLWFVKPKIER
ncbi:Glycosyltransferase, GT2 family [Psychroflexus salarius]|uniref:Glycosyltransferase, GT2 family n=1 Tax=Psychroflexus salarius TaxID=1155689 RepID=A0A1M4X312_9FLAO|nr:glycosyltransferase [Psychroflexus salarius]SHE87859.1 Glycosyltransferase, GT2 family [Psychroflexus salarius]